MWKNLRHSHVLSFLGVSSDAIPAALCMVLPWEENKNVSKYVWGLRTQEELSPADLLSKVQQWVSAAMPAWITQIVIGLTYAITSGFLRSNMKLRLV